MKLKSILCLALILSSALATFAVRVADSNSLRVVVIPSKTEVRLQEPFKVELRVENPTTTNQTVRVWSCSYDGEWGSSNTNISWHGRACTKNGLVDVQIPPGGAFTNELQMFIPKPISENTLSFRMGFTPIGSNQTFWSDPVILGVVPQDERATMYFKDYLAKCGSNEIRCLWFREDNTHTGVMMQINLQEKTVFAVQEVYNWSLHGSRTNQLTQSQKVRLEKLIQDLPASDKNSEFNASISVSIRKGGKLEVFQYDRRHAPSVIKRIYDLGGGYVYDGTNFALSTWATDTNSLRVVVIPSKTEVRVQEPFKVELRVENPTTTNQTVRVMTCSWDEAWKCSNTNISWQRWLCTANLGVNVQIPPSGAYTNELQMFISKPISEKTLSFRMGFTPIGSLQTFWSDPVILRVTPQAAAEAKTRLKVVKVDSEETNNQEGNGENAVDGNPNTYWHTQWQGNNPGLPHEIIIELIPPSIIKGFAYLPRQDASDHGTIKAYEFYVSKDGRSFGRPVKKGEFKPGKEENIETFKPVKCRFIKLRAISGINNLPWTSAAEIRVIQDSDDVSVIRPPPGRRIDYGGVKSRASDTDSFRIVAIPSKTDVRVQEPFKVALRVENPTKTNQTVYVMTCSWDEDWESSNTNISWESWECTKNFTVNVEIPPGGAYTKELQMFIPKPISENTLSFRMGFTSIGSNKTFWSEPVDIKVEGLNAAK